MDLLAAVPSVVYGLWGVFVLLPLFLQPAAEFLGQVSGFLPIFKGPASGISFFGAGVVLAIMIVPIISSLCREVFMAVPDGGPLRRIRPGRHTVGDDPRRRPAPGTGGHRGCGHAWAWGERWARPSPWRCSSASRQQITASILQPGYSMAAVIANQFQEAPATTSAPWWAWAWSCS